MRASLTAIPIEKDLCVSIGNRRSVKEIASGSGAMGFAISMQRGQGIRRIDRWLCRGRRSVACPAIAGTASKYCNPDMTDAPGLQESRLLRSRSWHEPRSLGLRPESEAIRRLARNA